MAPATPITGRAGTYVLLEAALPSSPVHTIGVLLVDLERNRLFSRLRGRFDDIAGGEDREVLEALEADIRQRAEEMGAAECLRWLVDTASNAIRVTDPEAIEVDSFLRVLGRLFDRHVEPVAIERYRTHLPLYAARAAAGSFSAEQALDEEPEDWVPSPVAGGRDLFVVRVTGHSMEPRIPAESLNVFRAAPAGSRQGKIVLVELLNVRDEAARFTVKRYTSAKRQTGEDEWVHERIRLEPLNPEYEAWDLEPGELKVIGEWVCTLE